MVKLLPCDHEVTGSSPGNSLLQKCRERLRTIDPKWSDPSPDPAQAGATCTGLPPYNMFVSKVDQVLLASKLYIEQKVSLLVRCSWHLYFYGHCPHHNGFVFVMHM